MPVSSSLSEVVGETLLAVEYDRPGVGPDADLEIPRRHRMLEPGKSIPRVIVSTAFPHGNGPCNRDRDPQVSSVVAPELSNPDTDLNDGLNDGSQRCLTRALRAPDEFRT
ncbi:glycohydrolase [Anopheles sinensis]|uniref:Glycohydrolase n=1 Tax=Anopheles sinensis TaxID=74873 RepID=A0A084VZP9_ANOSI|nr:glycohydrolase [Anopheles sinensis]